MKAAFAWIFVFTTFSLMLTPLLFGSHSAFAAPNGILVKTKSGLVASDSLTSTEINTSYWHFGGDAVALGAPYDYYQDLGGLHIGVQAANSGEWAGYYGVSPSSPAHLYHAALKIPFNSVQDHWWDTGMYVQTTSPVINYVTCAAVVSASGITWAIVSTKGNAVQATEFNTLWVDTSANQPSTRDCTLITNGKNLLRVFMDGEQVFSSSTLDLDMPEPFNVYLEGQTSTTSQMLYGAYSDYYATTDTAVKIVNAPVGGTVKLVDVSSGKGLGKSIVDSSGVASVAIAKHHMPLNAIVKVFDSANKLVATSTIDQMWAGDTYKVSPSDTTVTKNGDVINDSEDAVHYRGWNKDMAIHELPPSLFQ